MELGKFEGENRVFYLLFIFFILNDKLVIEFGVF